MTDNLTVIKACEERIESALWSFEVPGELEEALAVYREVENELDALDISAGQITYSEVQRVKAYCFLRQGNVLRQTDRAQEALGVGHRELEAARASGDELTLARSLMSNGTNLIVAGEIDRGLVMVEESRSLFEAGASDDFRQGLGWYWILIADLGNAGLLEAKETDVVHAADQALEILLPLENWTGIARAYAARAQAYEQSGDVAAAAADRDKQGIFEAKNVS